MQNETSVRVTDEVVESFLVWGRNYGEIESYRRVSERGRKWLIRLPDRIVTASGMELGVMERSVVPREIVLTSREALVFGYGLAEAGSRPETRQAHAEREWGW